MSKVIFNISFATQDGVIENFVYDPKTVTKGKILFVTYDPIAIGFRLTLTVGSYTFISPVNSDISELFLWVKENWSSYGKWLKVNSENRIYLYTENGETALLLDQKFGLRVLFPNLDFGEWYLVQLNSLETPGELLYNKSDVVFWLNENWGDIGEWETDGTYLIFIPDSIEDTYHLDVLAIGMGAFDSGFSPGFLI